MLTREVLVSRKILTRRTMGWEGRAVGRYIPYFRVCQVVVAIPSAQVSAGSVRQRVVGIIGRIEPGVAKVVVTRCCPLTARLYYRNTR